MTTLAQQAAARLVEAGDALQQTPALLGFDGFIDTILHVVDTRQSATEYTRLATIAEYGQRIVAAAGKSTNFEYVPTQVKLGGNGPIMAFAMVSLGVPVTYCGMTGYPTTEEVFRELGEQAKLLPISNAALTDALEFDDGKLICGKHATVAEVSYENILARAGADNWNAAWQEARFVGMVNWTMLPYLTDLWRQIQDDPALSGGPRKTLFIDLADPEKRTRADLCAALATIAQFQRTHDVVLGLNEKEALQTATALEVPVSFTEQVAEGTTDGDNNERFISELAAGIRTRLGIKVCVVHPTAFAAAADAEGAVAVAGPYTAKPKISTGAGDHFNAGFCVGRLIGCDLAQSLQIGVATSGYYVRNGASPTREQLAEFLESL